MKTPTLLAAAALLGIARTQADVISESFTLSSSTAIPDGDLNGLVQIIDPATQIGFLDKVVLALEILGGWNGDLYAYLWHDGEISILLNRTGRTTAAPAGSPTSGLTVTFDDLAPLDIHNAPGAFGTPLLGTYQPSARNVDPLSALDTSPRAASLGTFTGDPASGEWRLYIADVAGGDTATLTSWTLTLTGPQVPEPRTAALTLGAAAAFLLRRRRSA